jgi:hypothetical protein
MANWKETKEPYVQVNESIKKVSYPAAVGGDLIIGGAIVADAGDTEPILITDRSEILSNFTTDGKLTSKSHISLKNAYRLAGSNQLLLCRACSMGDSKFVQDINSPNMEGVVAKTPNHILMKDGMGLEKLSSPITIRYSLTGPEKESFFAITNMRAVLNEEGKVTSYVMRKVPQFGVDVLSVGTIGNSNDYSVTVNSLEALVNYLDETPYFKVTDIKETTTEKTVPEITAPDDPENETDKTAFANYYYDVYGVQSYSVDGFMYPDDENTKVLSNPVGLDIQGVKEIKSEDRVESYLQNNYSTAGKLDVSITPGFTVVDGENHFYYTIVITNATEDGGEYLVADDPRTGDGEISLDDFNELNGGVTIVADSLDEIFKVSTYDINEANSDGLFDEKMRSYKLAITDEELLKVGEADLNKALDKIVDDERYIVEGLCDFGITNSDEVIGTNGYQSTMASRTALIEDEPLNSNYFYVPSGTKSTNYLVIANNASLIPASHNVMYLAPWDKDSGTLGFEFDASPSVLYWEGVARNKGVNNEFAAMFGQTNGIVSPVKLAKKFGKKERQMLLAKRVNTIFEDVAQGATYINDDVVSYKTDDILNSENNVRLKIRINKSIPQLLSKFKGEPSNYRTWKEAREAVEYWFKSTVMTWNYTISEYKVVCDSTNNTAETIRQHKLVMRVMVRYERSTKYIIVYSDAYDLGIEFE